MINNLKFFIQIILLTPLIFLILILSPIFRVRIGKIKSNLIGHMTTPMEIFIGEKKIGLHPKNEIVLWYLQDGQITNKFLYKSLNKELLILPGIILFPLHIFFSKFRLTEKFVYYKVIETQKDRKKKFLGDKQIDDNDIFINSKSYINFSKKEIEYGDNFLKKNFIEKNQKFVCFASRSKNFKDESINSLRNGSIRSQILGINYLLDNKYKAVRMGRKEQEKMKDVNNNIFDYSFSNEIDDFLDIYIISKCKFMICTQHGLNEVATAMRVPKLVVNFWFWCDLYANHLSPIIVPKKIFSIKEKKLLNYVEIFKRGLDSNSTTESLGCNYESIDNNENEILDATKEMYNLVEFNNLDLKYQFNNQLDFWNKFKNYFGYLPKNTIISPSFFKQNEDLFC
jgi:putative glycosyltransferase (TIGR04372 family)